MVRKELQHDMTVLEKRIVVTRHDNSLVRSIAWESPSRQVDPDMTQEKTPPKRTTVCNDRRASVGETSSRRSPTRVPNQQSHQGRGRGGRRGGRRKKSKRNRNPDLVSIS